MTFTRPSVTVSKHSLTGYVGCTLSDSCVWRVNIVVDINVLYVLGYGRQKGSEQLLSHLQGHWYWCHLIGTYIIFYSSSVLSPSFEILSLIYQNLKRSRVPELAQFWLIMHTLVGLLTSHHNQSYQVWRLSFVTQTWLEPQNLKNGSCGHATLITLMLGVICHPKANTWYSLYLCTEFDESTASALPEIWLGPTNFRMGHPVPDHVPFRGGLTSATMINLPTKFPVSISTVTKTWKAKQM